MARSTNSPFVLLATLAVLTAVMTGVSRTGFNRAENATNSSDFANTTAGQLEVLSSSITELLPLLVLVVGAIAVIRTIQ